ncbi:MAG: response regulator transcription factor [Pseudomonadota bacterium]
MFNTLLVEDNVSFRQALSDVLLSYFPLIGVEEVGDGVEALNKVEYLRPNIIFIDIQLPGENGLDVTKEIKRVYGDIVVVILSANNLPEYRQQAFRDGADFFISKGDDSCLEDILALVEGAMARGARH